MSGKVKCTCGWSWNKSDSSKKDMYICHQCGKDNTMKNGGWLNKFQDGGEEEKTYGTYNLPEVVVTPEAEEQGFWKQSIRSYLDENKDAGLLGALGSVVTYPLGLPQQAMMYGLTGKVQKPSESLGIKNSLGALATDIIADPTNLFGVGLADDALKLSSKAGKFLKEETALKNAYKINPFAFKPNESNWYRQVGQSAVNDALETGLVREVGEEVSPRMWGEFQDQIKRLQGNDDILDYAERMKQQMLAGRRPISPFFAKGELFYPMGRKETITKSGKISKNPAGKGNADYLIETALPNESFQPAYVKGMSLGVPDMIGSTAILKPNPSLRDLNNFQLYKQDWLRGYKQIPKKENGGWLNKFDEVPEAQNGIEGTMGGLTDQGFNYNGAWGGTMAMGGSIPGAVGFTYARTQGSAPANGKYTKKTKASAQNGEEMKFYQEGLDWKPKSISKDGSVTKDKKDKPVKEKVDYRKDNIYYGPTEFKECYGEGCSKQATKKVASLYGVDYDELNPQDAWYKKAAVIKGGGKSIYDKSQGVLADAYENLKIGDFVSLDREGSLHAKDASRVSGYDISDNEKTEHLGYVVGFNKEGVPLIRHGWEGSPLMDAKSYVQPITKLSLPELGLNYDVSSIYRPEKLLKDANLKTDKYYKEILPVENLEFFDKDNVTKEKKKYLKAFNKNSKEFQIESGLSPEEVSAIGNISYGIFGNESSFNSNIKNKTIETPFGDFDIPVPTKNMFRIPKQMGKELLYNIGAAESSPSLGPTQLKYTDAKFNKDNTITGTGKLMDSLGTTRGGMSNYTTTNYDAVTKGTFANLANKYKQLKSNPKFEFNPENNTVFGNVPIGYALARAWQNPSLSKLKETLQNDDSDYSKAAYKNMSELEGNVFPVNLPEVVVTPDNLKDGGWLSKFEDGGKKSKKLLQPEIQYMENYLESPMYLERLAKMAGTEKQLQDDSYGKFKAEQFSQSNVTDPLKDIAFKQGERSKEALDYIKDNISIGDYDLGRGVAGVYDSGVKDIRLRKDLFAQNPTVGIHELSHATLTGREPYTKDFQEKYLDPIFLNPGSVGWEPIVQKPTEVKARLDSIRYLANKKGLYNPGKEKFTEKHLQLLEKDPEISKDFNYKQLKDQLKKGTKKTGFIWMMNNIAKLQDEESNSLPFAKDGKVITDPKGQWAHPGEITRIPSNQITMQGVPYPVMGISDTGDTQMMYPDQEYSYEGKSVTEYPMMQDGGKTSLRSLINNDGLKAKSDATKVVPKLIRSTTEGEGDNNILKAIRQHLYKTVQPADYADAEGNVKPIVEGILKNKDRFDIEGKEKKYRKLNDELMTAFNAGDREKVDTLLPQVQELENKNVGGIDDPYSEAGWKKYLGLTDPKKDTVFTKSNYSPSEGEEKNVTYYSLPKAFEKDLLKVYYTNTNNGKNKLESTAFNESEFSGAFGEGKSRARVLGNFKIDEGEDDKGKYVSYYDKYDLSPELPLLGNTSIDFLGKPFEIYNRVYLNNNTGKKENGGWLNKYN